jgi:hypothetical protein
MDRIFLGFETHNNVLEKYNVTCRSIARQRANKHAFMTTEDGVFYMVRINPLLGNGPINTHY